MPLGTLDRTPPPFFKQGPSALSKLVVFSAIALFLMVADLRFKVTAPLRMALAAVIYPGQWLVMQPIEMAIGVRGYFTSLEQSRTLEAEALKRLSEQASRSQQVEQLNLENRRLRELLGLRDRAQVAGIGAQVLYDAADPYTRRVVIDRGQTHGVKAGAPVIDEAGVLGQVTRVYPLVSEVSLLVDPDQAIPVLNARTGLRSIAFGQPSRSGDGMELRYTVANADIAVGDLLTTSGVDGIYPPGLAVARVTDIERAADSSFARIRCEPVARVQAALHVIVLHITGEALPAVPDEAAATTGRASP
jgi:rod shape-determining protein MreC